jgi:sulfite oxidase
LASDFDKHTRFIVHHESPFNGGPPHDLLCQAPITPRSLFYVRNHGSIPTIDPTSYRLIVRGVQTLQLSLDDLHHNFQQVTQTTTLQCAGNRRREMIPDADPVAQVMWDTEAISTAEWTGARLADVLRAAGVPESARHAAFVGLDACEKDGKTFGFGGSIALEKALHPDVLLAHSMNGEPLAPVHGFPLRVVAPGTVAARSVKWLGEIILQAQPSDNYFQQRDYKMFPPDVREQTVDWAQGAMLDDQALNAVICVPADGAQVDAGIVRVVGYAIAGGDATLRSVELSQDGGATWQAASLQGEAQTGAWQLWQADVSLAPGQHTLVVRAFDTSGAAQPADLRPIWNFRGYMNNAWHRVSITTS